MTGKGPAVLLLHGWGDSAKGFAATTAALASGYTVIAPDLPGFGASQAPDGVWNLDNYAKFLAQFLKKLNITDVHAVVGHSNGGAVAIRALSINAIKADKLILIASAGIRTTNQARKTIIKVIAKVGKVLTLWLPRSTRRKLQKKLYGSVGSDMFVAEDLKETFKLTVKQDVQADAAKLTLPTLLIYARDDTAVPLQDGKTYQRLIKGSSLSIIDNASHFVHVDQAADVNTLIKDFLA
ncbi:MAG: alpha/beta hydrolase [Candidatus Saccharibacteria bacterium]|nr:alpha/beta hydrolase [Candidatus Saccharibacteria bacterium]